MTAIRNFPDAPLRHAAAARLHWQTPDWLLKAWRAMERYGYRRAAGELEIQARIRGAGDSVLARQLNDAAVECRRAALPASERSPS